jgi:integrase
MASALSNSESFDGRLTCSQNVIPATSDSIPVMNENISTVGRENPSTLRRRAVNGPREENLARRRHQDGQLLKLKRGWAVRYYEDYFHNSERRRRRVQKFLGDFGELPTKRKALSAMDVELAAVNNFTNRPRTTTTFAEFANLWVERCKTRKRKPIKPSTLCNWESILENHILPVLRTTPLSSVDNGALKHLVAELVRKDLSPQTIKNIVLVAKLVKASAMDDDGNELYPTTWNHEFIDMPIVDETKQRKPTFTGEEVTAITKAATGRLQMACVLFAASGLRAGELLALEIRHFDGSSIKVEQDVWCGKVQPPKTPNSRRTIDLAPDAADLLKQFIGDRTAGFIFQTSGGKPITQTNLLKREFHPTLATLGISKRGFHSFRRFRNTHLRNSICPDGLLKFWMGHASKDMSDRYDRVRDDEVFRKEVARSMGTGFEVPKTLAPKPKKAKKSVTEISVSGVIGREEESAMALSY